jgi:hypothetical protein
MKSTDLVNWQLVSYAYDILDDVDELNLTTARTRMGVDPGPAVFAITTECSTPRRFPARPARRMVHDEGHRERTWKASSFKPSLHDHSLFFADDGRVYMMYGAGDLRLVELTEDATGTKPGGFNKVVVPNASAVAGNNINLRAEGSQSPTFQKTPGRYPRFEGDAFLRTGCANEMFQADFVAFVIETNEFGL